MSAKEVRSFAAKQFIILLFIKIQLHTAARNAIVQLHILASFSLCPRNFLKLT